MTPYILDACCGGRMFWFNKNHPGTIYIDKRKEKHGHVKSKPGHSIIPDQIADFRSLPYKDKSFKLVVFDPPHYLKKIGESGIIAKSYGILSQNWRDDLRQGFKECMRVLDDFGILIFKWSSAEIKLNEVLECCSQSPLFGHNTNNKNTTHWVCFIKEGG